MRKRVKQKTVMIIILENIKSSWFFPIIPRKILEVQTKLILYHTMFAQFWY